MRQVVCVLMICATGAAACNSPTAPRYSPGISVLSGGGQSDTINATLPRKLILEVANSSGKASAGQPIEFSGISPRAGLTSNTFVQGPHSKQASSYEVDTTDSFGGLAVTVTLGGGSGPALLVVKALNLGVVDTVQFTVLPGNPVTLSVNPDTVVYIGSHFVMNAVNMDGWGNPRPADSVSLTVLNGPITLAGKQATATTYGRSQIVASSQLIDGLHANDTMIVTVVPHGTIMAGLAFGGIAMFNLDGSGFRVLSDITTGTVRWAPSGTQAVFTEYTGAFGPSPFAGPIAVIDTATSVRALDSLPSGLPDANPIYSRDGASIYFNRITSPDTIWRMRADGTGIGPVTTNTVGNYFWPTPSPDGSQLAFVDLNTNMLEILNLASGTVTNLNVVAQSPQWSPGSDLIGFIATASGAGPIAVVHADGTGQRVVASGSFARYFDWSPDGSWLVAWDSDGQRLEIVSADSGVVLPLDYASHAISPTILPSTSPAWQPGAHTASYSTGREVGTR